MKQRMMMLLACALLLVVFFPRLVFGSGIEIEFWHALSGENGRILERFVGEFNDENPGIHVTPIYQGHYRDLFQKLSGAAQAQQLPAMTMIYANRLTGYIMNDLVTDLTPFIFDQEIGFSPEEWEDIPEFFRNDGIWDGRHYSFPYNKGGYLMYYNQDLLSAAGLQPPTTWDELREAAEILTKDGVTGVVFNNSVGIDFSFWVEQAGGTLIDEETGELHFHSEAGEEAYAFVTGMIRDGVARLGEEDFYIVGPLARGEAAIGFASTSHLPSMAEAATITNTEWGTAKLPTGKRQAALFSGTDIAIFNTVSLEEQEAAWSFIKFWLREDITSRWGMESGYLPLTYSAALSPSFLEFLEHSPAKGHAMEQYPYGYQDPKVLNGYAIHRNMQNAFEEIIFQGRDIREALLEAKEITRRELDEALASF